MKLNFLWSCLGDTAIVLILIAALARAGVVRVERRWALATLGLFLVCMLLLWSRNTLLPMTWVFPEAKWNWGGKILAMGLWMGALVWLVKSRPGFRVADVGLTWRQNDGSLLPALVVISLLLIWQSLQAFLEPAAPANLETLLFQGILPGLDEELMFRGVLLYYVGMAVPTRRISIFGAGINLAGALLVLLFGLLHGLRYDDGWQFSLLVTSSTGLYGFLFLWLRERTGSLLLPVLGHNAVNLISVWPFGF